MKTTIFTVLTGVSGRKFSITGTMLKYKTSNGLYLSSNKPSFPTTYYDFYSKIKHLSASNPGFSAIPITEYKIINDNTLNFTLTSFRTVQKINIIYANPAGYALATDSKFFSYIHVISATS